MGDYKVFDGTNWVNPCTCNVHVMQSNDVWKLLEPRTCPTRYWDGTEWCLITCGTQISEKTEINIWFDSSGSMNQTLPALENMRDELLKDCLLPLYNNDLLLYNERVKIISSWTERSIKQLGTVRNYNETILQNPAWVNRSIDLTVDLVINLVYSDEGQGNADYWKYDCLPDKCNPAQLFPVPTTQQAGYLNDVAYTRGTVEAAIIDPNPYEIKGAMFRVATSDPALIRQRELVELLFNDNALYFPPTNLSDYLTTNFQYRLDTLKGQSVNSQSPFISFQIYYLANNIDWNVGTYLNTPVTTVGIGSGAGMLLNIEVLQHTGIGTASVVAPGIGTYTPNATLNGSLNFGNGANTGNNESVIFTTDSLGNPTAITGFNTVGDGFIVGENWSLYHSSNPSQINQAIVTIDTVVIYNPFTITGIASYGNELYLNTDTLEVQPPITAAPGVQVVNIQVGDGTGFPSYYLAEVVSSLNQLGLAINCS